MALSTDSPVRAIDRRIAERRTGFRTKGPPAYEVLATSLGIKSVGDLLRHYPRRYIDRSQVSSIGRLKVGQQATTIARVKRVAKRLTRQRRTMVSVTLYDGSGYLDLTFFNQPWTAGLYREGQEVAVSGTVGLYKGKLQLQNQEVEILSAESDSVHTGRITPVHPATEGISTRTVRELIYKALEGLPELSDPLPAELVKSEGLIRFDRAIRSIHFPESDGDLEAALERLKFDELFMLELGVALRKHRVESSSVGIAQKPHGDLLRRFEKSLPFEPTSAQTAAISQIEEAMARDRPMNVLLQGDVGSGKTLVALHAALVAVASGHQVAIMAPTEVLAAQHGRSVAELLAPLGASPHGRVRPTGQTSLLDGEGSAEAEGAPSLTFAVLAASVTGKERALVLEGLAAGTVDLVVGTHALVQEGVSFADLSLAVIDEQHRFGVHQRMALKGKGADPDVLIMTATPIPRTLSLTYYGDLDVCVLDEMPSGRRPAETRIARTPAERKEAYGVIRREVAAGRQAFVVCAAIDESNKAEVKAAEEEAQRLATKVFPELSVQLLHGRMRPADKDARMEAFRRGEHDVLIATTVIEVGVDVPNATVMLVENAERFGLAQLHQLRGRIGRGAHLSYCFLFDHGKPDNLIARERLEAMQGTADGFELADEDLRLRGEGTLFDVKQSGMPDLRLARLAEDLELVKRARSRAFAVIAGDPSLEQHPSLRAELEHTFAESIDWLFHA